LRDVLPSSRNKNQERSIHNSSNKVAPEAMINILQIRKFRAANKELMQNIAANQQQYFCSIIYMA